MLVQTVCLLSVRALTNLIQDDDQSIQSDEVMITKENLLKSMENMPDQFTVDELLDRVILLEKIETGLKQSEEGKTFSTDEARKKLKKWLK